MDDRRAREQLARLVDRGCVGDACVVLDEHRGLLMGGTEIERDR